MAPASRTLAERLTDLHDGTGLTAALFAVRLGWGPAGRPRVSRIRHGRVTPSRADIRAWAGAAGRPEAIPALLSLLADEEHRHRGWGGRLHDGAAGVQHEWDARVRAASSYRAVSPLLIPGLLQTRPYALAVFAQGSRAWAAPDPDAAAQARMGRQRALYDEPGKPFQIVTTEAALLMPPVPPPLMAAQLARLAGDLDLPNLTLGVIPLGVPLEVAPVTAFTLLDGQAVVESWGGEDEPGPEESAVYAAMFDALMAEAATGGAARRIIAAARARFDTPPEEEHDGV